jgi:uncharacterized membrane protein
VKLRILNGILIIDILSIILILCVLFFKTTAIRVILGLPFLLFFPGYLLVSILFIKAAMGRIERIGLSISMSFAIVGLIGFGLNYTPWGIQLVSILYSITGFIFLASIVALIRIGRTTKINKFTTVFTFRLSDLSHNYISIILVLSVICVLGVLCYSIAVPKTGEKFTEFYILGMNGDAQNYPSEYFMRDGVVAEVIYNDGILDANHGLGAINLAISNQEDQTKIYYVKLTVDGQPTNIELDGVNNIEIGPIELRQGEKWERAIGILPQHLGDNQKVELSLFMDSQNIAYNSLHFWINVKQSN